ncbi:MAG: polysaccharide deacetylase family protein [Burkholderiales bacterium]|nr:polysaccharide deacetylase family protein [Burkholderiales bacterium]
MKLAADDACAATAASPVRVHWTRHLTRALVSRGRGTHLTILIYHRVHAAADPMSPEEVDARTFDWQVRCLCEYFHILPLDEAVEKLGRRALPQGAVSITFDDGYRDNCEVALPVLRRHGASATFFVATDFLGGGIMFNDVVIESLRRTASSRLDLSELGYGTYDLADTAARRAAVRSILPALKREPWRERARKAFRLAQIAAVQPPADLMLTPEQVRALHRSGMTIGAHTVHHPILASMDDSEASVEIDSSKRALEAITGEEVTLFAYPNGRPDVDYLARHVAMAKASGFSAAASTAPGIASETTDIYQLPRFMPWDRSPRAFVARLVRNSFNKNVLHAGHAL